MLRAILCCVLVAATAAIAWQSRDAVPSPAEVGTGAHITWGADGVWGMFPTDDAEDPATYVGFYDPPNDAWTLLDEPMEWEYLQYTGLTFQWMEEGVLFGIGEYDGDAYLYFYSLYSQEWDSYDIDEQTEFALGGGACIAYQPNVNYTRQMNPVPGWIYCLPGGETQEFWRYAIPTSLPNMALDGIYPGSGAVIADQTPLFQWADTTQQQHRLLVSTNSLFSDTVLDKVTSNPEYQDSSVLANGTYYWRTAAWAGSAWSWGLAHSFELEGGWQQLANIPGAASAGAAIAYDADYFGHQSIIAFRGGGNSNFYEYSIVGQSWSTENATTMDEDPGTSLTTHDPTEQAGFYPWSAFGASTTSDNPWYYNDAWTEWVSPSPNPLYNSYFPEDLGPEASMVYGQNHLMYLVVGENHFYRVDPPGTLMDGEQATGVRSIRGRAHIVIGHAGVEVEYQLSTASHVRARLHDAVGRQVGSIDAGEQKPGTHRLSWGRNGHALSAGAYFVLLDLGTSQSRLKAVVR